MHRKSNQTLETIYEDDEETNVVTEDRTFQPTTTNNSSQKRFSCYICWTAIGGAFFLITLFIAFSINPFFSIYSTSNLKLIGNHNYDVDFSTPSSNQFETSDRLVAFVDQFSEKINDELNLPAQTINLFTLRIANQVFWKENQLAGIYFHLDYPQFCWDNQQCRENFQVYLNETMTTFSTEISFLSVDSIEFTHCTTIENTTSITSIGFIALKTNDVELIETIDHHFCEEIDHFYILYSFFDRSQRHRNLFSLGIDSNGDECSNHSQNDEFDYQEKSMLCNSKASSLSRSLLWNSY